MLTNVFNKITNHLSQGEEVELLKVMYNHCNKTSYNKT